MLKFQNVWIVIFLVVGLILFSSVFCNGQNIDCSTIASGPDLLAAKGLTSPYLNSNGPLTVALYVHVLRQSDGTGGLSQSQVASHILQLQSDFKSMGIYFIVKGEAYIDNDLWYSDPVGNSVTIFSSNFHQDSIDLYLGPNDGTIRTLAKSIPSTGLILAGAAENTAAISHVMGHCLGLYDTHETFFDSGGQIFLGDLVSDTPEDPGLAGYVETNCSLSDTFLIMYPEYSPSTTNTMSASRTECLSNFSLEQGNRIMVAFEEFTKLSGVLAVGDVVYENVSSDTGLVGGWGSNAYVKNASTADFTNNGYQDLLLSFSSPTVEKEGQAWEGASAIDGVPQFVNVTQDWFLTGELPADETSGFIFADYDNDGLIDVYAPNTRGHKLFHNEGPSGFKDVTAFVGLDSISRPSWEHGATTIGGSWGDYDADGYVDLLLLMFHETDSGSPNDPFGTGSETQFLMRNTTGESGNTYGSFVDVTPNEFFEGDAGPYDHLTRPRFIMSALWADYDQDHDVDLILVQSHSTPIGGNPGANSRFFENQGDGTFQNTTPTFLPLVAHWNQKFSTAVVSDFDNDGSLDVGYHQRYELGVFFNNGLGALSTNWSSYESSSSDDWDLASVDYDLDGRMDLVVSKWYPGPNLYGNRLDEENSFYLTKENNTTGFDNNDSRAITWGLCLADFTRDGWTEFLMGRRQAVGGPDSLNFFFQVADTSIHNDWIGISTKSTNGKNNYLGLGATVTVNTGSYIQAQVVDGGSGRASQHAHELVFGLGQNASSVVVVTVSWPNGFTQVSTLAKGICHEILDASFVEVDDSSVSTRLIYHADTLESDWEFTWETNFEGNCNKDKVVFVTENISPACMPSLATLSPSTSGVVHSVVYSEQTSSWLHTLVWQNVPCESVCFIPFKVQSGNDLYVTESLHVYLLKVFVCLFSP